VFFNAVDSQKLAFLRISHRAAGNFRNSQRLPTVVAAQQYRSKSIS